MESKIELFLFLAREEVDRPHLPTSALPALEECLQYLPRRPDREYRVHVDVAPQLRLQMSPEALRILLDSMIANALRDGWSLTLEPDNCRLRVVVMLA